MYFFYLVNLTLIMGNYISTCFGYEDYRLYSFLDIFFADNNNLSSCDSSESSENIRLSETLDISELNRNKQKTTATNEQLDNSRQLFDVNWNTYSGYKKENLDKVLLWFDKYDD